MQANGSHQTKLAAALAIPSTMAVPMAAPAPVARYVTIKQAAQHRSAFTEAAFRDIRFKAFDRKNSRGDVIEGNGSGEAGVWIEVGGKVLVDLPAFDRWIESHKVVASIGRSAAAR